MSVQTLTDRLSFHASAIIGSAYDTLATEIKAGLWKVIASVLDELPIPSIEWGVEYVRDGAAGQSLATAWEKITLLDSAGPTSSAMTSNLTDHRITTSDPGTYLVLAVASISNGADRTFDFEIRQWDSSAASAVATGFAASRLLPSTGAVGLVVIAGLVQLADADGVELGGKSNLPGGATCYFAQGQLLAIRLGD